MSNANIIVKETVPQLQFHGIFRSFKVILNLLNEENINVMKQVLLDNSRQLSIKLQVKNVNVRMKRMLLSSETYCAPYFLHLEPCFLTIIV